MLQNKVRYINAAPVEEYCENRARSAGTWSGAAYAAALQTIRDAPTVDAVEVVRCKDCIYATAEDGYLYCYGPIGIDGTVGFNNFCSYGERRTEDGNCKAAD